MTKDEALKRALEALETNNKAWKHLADSGDAGFWEAEEQPFYELSVKAITAIKEALAQPEREPTNIERHERNVQKFLGASQPKEPEQEPVAVVDVHEFYDNCANFSLLQKLPKGKHTLYTTPPQRKPLTDEERLAIRTKWMGGNWTCGDIIDAVEAAHNIKE